MQETSVLALKQASAHIQQGEIEAALDICDQAIPKDPDAPLLRRLKASLLLQQKNFDDAEVELTKALELNPTDRETAQLLAITFSDNQNPQQAQGIYQQLLSQPSDPGVISDYGLNLCRLGRFVEARECYQKVLQHVPDRVITAFNLGTLDLFLGNFSQGWEGYGLRYIKDNVTRPQLAPDWKGESLQGKHLVIYREQGIGDELLMATCYQDAIEQAGQCTILCNPRLNGILSRSFSQAQVIDIDQMTGDRISDFDFDLQTSAADLPQFFRQDLTAFSNVKPLSVDSSLRSKLRARLEKEGKKFYIGLSWLGGKPLGEKLNYRSFPLKALYPLLQTPDVCWVNLQHGDIEQEVQQAISDTGAHIVTIEEASPYGDFDDYSALVMALDSVVSADGAVSNLAGAIGQKCYLLAGTFPFWWWTYNHSPNPWFPSVNVFFKSAESSNWDAVVTAVQHQLITDLEQVEAVV